MLTAYADTRLVVRAMKAGACDYLLKPLKLKALLTVLQNALVSHPVPAITSSVPAVGKLVGMSRGIMEMKELILRYGASMSPVLIQGESGTGKELVARAVHSVSGVSGAFVAINCGAIPEQLVEAELFGTEKGAYTDAQPRAGSFERADGGCLFLDEIGEMAMTAQVKLLRIMEEREVSRLGGTRPVPIDVRILAATNKSLSEGVKSGTFREDLYYRLAVLPIQVPSLREHPEDIPLLAASMLQELEGTGKKLSHEALVKLQRHSWPGNVRELRNVLERAVLLSEGPSLLPGHIRF
jgi:DNA-binding NtrC family response regulator